MEAAYTTKHPTTTNIGESEAEHLLQTEEQEEDNEPSSKRARLLAEIEPAVQGTASLDMVMHAADSRLTNTWRSMPNVDTSAPFDMIAFATGGKSSAADRPPVKKPTQKRKGPEVHTPFQWSSWAKKN